MPKPRPARRKDNAHPPAITGTRLTQDWRRQLVIRRSRLWSQSFWAALKTTSNDRKPTGQASLNQLGSGIR